MAGADLVSTKMLATVLLFLTCPAQRKSHPDSSLHFR